MQMILLLVGIFVSALSQAEGFKEGQLVVGAAPIFSRGIGSDSIFRVDQVTGDQLEVHEVWLQSVDSNGWTAPTYTMRPLNLSWVKKYPQYMQVGESFEPFGRVLNLPASHFRKLEATSSVDSNLRAGDVVSEKSTGVETVGVIRGFVGTRALIYPLQVFREFASRLRRPTMSPVGGKNGRTAALFGVRIWDHGGPYEIDHGITWENSSELHSYEGDFSNLAPSRNLKVERNLNESLALVAASAHVRCNLLMSLVQSKR